MTDYTTIYINSTDESIEVPTSRVKAVLADIRERLTVEKVTTDAEGDMWVHVDDFGPCFTEE